MAGMEQQGVMINPGLGAMPKLEGIQLDVSWAALVALPWELAAHPWDLLLPAAIALALLASQPR